MNFLGSRYKNPVIDNLSRERAGLALRYDEWPGQTLMVIPIGTGLGGPLSAIDTAAISDSRVIDHLRQEPDMGLEQRRDMVDLMEREADHAAQQAAITREAIQQEEQRIAQEQERLRQEQERLRQEQEQQRQEADQPALAQRQEELRQQQQELEQRQEELNGRLQEAERQEAFAEQRVTEAQQQRQQIAQDQQALIDQEPPPPIVAGILGISILNPDSAMGRLVLIDNTGMVTRQSPLNTVNTRTVTLLNNRIFAIAGENRGAGAIRIVEISNSTLEMQRQGDFDIAPESLLWVNGQDLFAIVTNGTNLNLARFNSELALQSQSSVYVHPFASVFFYNGYLITQQSDGSAALLDPGNLSERR
jgi:hypothetical protein